MIDCQTIQAGYLRQICEGTSGLSPEIEEQYRRHWETHPPFSETAGPPPDFSCIHRGAVTRRPECELCGGRIGPVDVFVCALYGECSQNAHGIRAAGPASAKIPVCISCDDRVGVQSAF